MARRRFSQTLATLIASVVALILTSNVGLIESQRRRAAPAVPTAGTPDG